MGNDDLYYFYENDLNKGNLDDFFNSLPTHIRAKFAESMGGISPLDRDTTNVAQGYRGPKNNGSSGDSEYLGPSNGLQEVRYKWGISKLFNLVPIIGQAVFLVGRAAGDTDWHQLYFDSKTGECLSHDQEVAASKLNEIGRQLFDRRRFNEAEEYFNNAYIHSSNKDNYGIYIKNRDLARTQQKETEASNLCARGCELETEGNNASDNGIKQQKYEAARVKFEEAANITANQENKTIYINNQALMLSKIGDVLHNAGQYRQALAQYNDAIVLSNSESNKKLYYAS